MGISSLSCTPETNTNYCCMSTAIENYDSNNKIYLALKVKEKEKKN